MSRQEQEENVRIVREATGHVHFRGGAYDRASPQQRESLDHLYEMADALREIESAREEEVCEARRLGLSWHAIALTYGVTGEAARRRFGAVCEDEGVDAADD